MKTGHMNPVIYEINTHSMQNQGPFEDFRPALPDFAVGACNIPLDELRGRLSELPKNREILVFCRSGQRAYYATRILLQNGFKAKNISGGMLARSVRMKTEIVGGSLD